MSNLRYDIPEECSPTHAKGLDRFNVAMDLRLGIATEAEGSRTAEGYHRVVIQKIDPLWHLTAYRGQEVMSRSWHESPDSAVDAAERINWDLQGPVCTVLKDGHHIPIGSTLTVTQAVAALDQRMTSCVEIIAPKCDKILTIHRTMQPARWRVTVFQGKEVRRHNSRETAREAMDEALGVLQLSRKA